MSLMLTYFAFALDPVGTLRILGDDEATRAQNLPTKIYSFTACRLLMGDNPPLRSLVCFWMTSFPLSRTRPKLVL